MENKKIGLPEGAYGDLPGEEYVPYIPPEKSPKEFTWVAIFVGIGLAIIFGAANAYLGLKVGMTVSASIPAAVISMAIIRGIMRRDSILENNMVQTLGSAGESLAAGVIFTLPALFLWADRPSLVRITIISMIGGLLGVLMMIILRRYLIVKEHGKLPYPEGTACAEVLVAGEVGGSGARLVFGGLAVGGIFNFLTGGMKWIHDEVETLLPLGNIKNAVVGAELLPALTGVGYIIGPQISSYMLSGAVLGWLGFIPFISYLGGFIDQPIYPATEPISSLGAGGIWNSYIRYIGAGAVAMGGFISLVKSIPTILKAFKGAMGGLTSGIGSDDSVKRTDHDLPIAFVMVATAVLIVIIAMTDLIPVGVVGAILVTVFGFFFVTVSSRLVGIVGSSSNPISGMTIATLLLTTIILKGMGFSGIEGMIGALSVGAVVCIAAAIAGDTSQDLKTGFLVGATPRLQQIGELIAVVVSALVVGWVLVILNHAYGFGSRELAAPQATLMKLVIEGIMEGNLPWPLVFIGMITGLTVEMLGIASLPFAVGLYLPIHLSVPIMIGGLIRFFVEKRTPEKTERKEKTERGILYSSGLIAGEGLMGVALAIHVAIQEIPVESLADSGFFGIIAAGFVQIIQWVNFELPESLRLGDGFSFFLFLLLSSTLIFFSKKPKKLE
ncbi:MAG: oligopeptide transporter, OPT family [Candidatus Cloacimonetes bacterium 4572_55]|nr:MAG: oligopeptide transporter, OPT family [Candidatus Cloacimonetes bacterium 4572_55]